MLRSFLCLVLLATTILISLPSIMLYAKPSGSPSFCRIAQIEALFEQAKKNPRTTKISLPIFYQEVRKKNRLRRFRSFRSGQFTGTDQLLQFWNDSPHFKDLRWLAYILATTYHETAGTMQPIREYGRGRGKRYGSIYKPTGQRYFGRGYVQLTWHYNYKRADKELKLKNALYLDADKAMEYPIARKIIYRGMIKGWFGGDKHCLPRYFRENVRGDWKNARRMVNILDKWELIKNEALDFLDVLKKSQVPIEQTSVKLEKGKNHSGSKEKFSILEKTLILQKKITDLELQLKRSQKENIKLAQQIKHLKEIDIAVNKPSKESGESEGDIYDQNFARLARSLTQLQDQSKQNQKAINQIEKNLINIHETNKKSDIKLEQMLTILDRAFPPDDPIAKKSIWQKFKNWSLGNEKN